LGIHLPLKGHTAVRVRPIGHPGASDARLFAVAAFKWQEGLDTLTVWTGKREELVGMLQE
jgi:hypothetical protein